jgi:hypothetical protein
MTKFAKIFLVKKLAICAVIFLMAFKFQAAFGQQVDSIYFHLYTDSLKRNIYNYISVDGKLKDGRYIPLDTKQLVFESNAGKWSGNSIYFDSGFTAPSVNITVYMKDKPQVKKTLTLFFRTYIPVEVLKSEKELLDEWKNKPKKKKGTTDI